MSADSPSRSADSGDGGERGECRYQALSASNQLAEFCIEILRDANSPFPSSHLVADRTRPQAPTILNNPRASQKCYQKQSRRGASWSVGRESVEVAAESVNELQSAERFGQNVRDRPEPVDGGSKLNPLS
jgi:hypothetical protein